MSCWLVFFCNSVLAAIALSQSTAKPDEGARSSAAEADLPFLTVFAEDLNSNLPAYTSFMASNDMTLPQAVADYYFHLMQLSQTADLQKDVASSFPFTQFQTFVTNFPWYDSLLQRASVSTLYVPQDFVSTGTTGTQSQSLASKALTTSSNDTARSASPSQTGSSNAAVSINKGHVTLFLVLLGFIF